MMVLPIVFTFIITIFASYICSTIENGDVSAYFSSNIRNMEYLDSFYKQLSSDELINPRPENEKYKLKCSQSLIKKSNGKFPQLTNKGSYATHQEIINETSKKNYFSSNGFNDKSNKCEICKDDMNRLESELQAQSSHIFLNNNIEYLNDLPLTIKNSKNEKSFKDGPLNISVKTDKYKNLDSNILVLKESDSTNESEEVDKLIKKFLEDYGVTQFNDAFIQNKANFKSGKKLESRKKINNLFSNMIKSMPSISDIIINKSKSDLNKVFNNYNLLQLLSKYENGQAFTLKHD